MIDISVIPRKNTFPKAIISRNKKNERVQKSNTFWEKQKRTHFENKKNERV